MHLDIGPFYFVCSIIIAIIATISGGKAGHGCVGLVDLFSLALAGPIGWCGWPESINACPEPETISPPIVLLGLGCIRPVDADLVPWALLTTRTTVNGPTVSVSCPLLVCLCVQFYVLELASWKLLQPEWGRGHFFSVINIDNKRLHEAIAFQLIIHKRALKKLGIFGTGHHENAYLAGTHRQPEFC